MDLGRQIKELRSKHKLTQKELANKAGLSHIAIKKIEQNVRFGRIETLQAIASATNTSVNITFTPLKC